MMDQMTDNSISKDTLESVNYKIESLTDEVKILKSKIYEIVN